jgi:LuxR family maltose regulon positive regulatory protein
MYSDFPILSTKFNRPIAQNKAIIRQRLHTKLTTGWKNSLIMVSAPAGFGKSTLISEWIAENDNLIPIWISLSKEDNDQIHFLFYLIKAFQKQFNEFDADLLVQLTSTQSTPLKQIAAHLMVYIAQMKSSILIVFDDFHLISNPIIHDVLTYLLNNMPENLSVAIITRADPPLPMSKLRLQQRLLEIRAQDLSFNLEEAVFFFQQSMALNLQTDDVNMLVSKTEGWIVGLQLAALSLQNQNDTHHFVSRFKGSQHFVLDYLLEEVLSTISTEAQYFLLKTSFLDKFCGPLCDFILSKQGSGIIIEDLYRQNLFIFALDMDHHWFRYHHLFAEGLQRQLNQKFPEDIAELNLRACQWYSLQNLPEEAIPYALAANEISLAAKLIQQCAKSMIKTGRIRTLMHWLHDLPEKILFQHPQLALIAIQANVLSGKLAKAGEFSNQLRKCLHLLPKEERTFTEGCLEALLSTHATFAGDSTATIEHAEKALELLSVDKLSERAIASLNLGNARILTGEIDLAIPPLTQAVDWALACRNFNITNIAIANLGDILQLKGEFDLALKTLNKGIQHLETQIGPDFSLIPSSSLVFTSLSNLQRELNNINSARENAIKSIELANISGLSVAILSAQCNMAALHRSEGNLEKAYKEINLAINHLQDPMAEALLTPLFILRGYIQLEMGLIDPVANWLKNQQDLRSKEDFDYITEPIALLEARFLIHQNQFSEAIELLQNVKKAANENNRIGRAIEANFLLSIAHYKKGLTYQAFSYVDEVLRMRENYRFTRLILDEKNIFPEILNDYLSIHNPSNHMRCLALELKNLFASSAPIIKNTHPEIPELTIREKEILNLMASGVSNNVIAEKLTISTGTVKTHINHIMKKLNTKNRTETVLRAQSLDMV